MLSFITHFTLKLIKNLIIFGLIFLQSCNGSSIKSKNSIKHTLLTIKGSEIHLRVSASEAQKLQGLSGVRKADFKINEGMLFFYKSDGVRQFWMPNTFFNLDIIFLDKNFKIVHIDHNVQAHPGLSDKTPIARTKSIYCRHVLEIRSDSPLAREVQVGNTLKWKTSSSILEIKSNTHLSQ